MSDSPYIADVTAQDFQTLVLDNSHQVPVLVDFWAPWCGPCRMLTPLLTKLADEYQGKFLLAKVNTEEEQTLAAQFGIRSIPTMMLFKNGEVVNQILGALPEAEIRAMLDRYIERESDRVREAAAQAVREGDSDRALALLRQAAESDPANPRVQFDLLSLWMEQGHLEEAEGLLDRLKREFRDDPRLPELTAKLQFAQIVKDAPDAAALEKTIQENPADCGARYRLGARKVLSGDYETALNQFLEVLRRDRKFEDDAGRKGILAVFDLLGGQGELVNRYRRLMAGAIL